MLDKMTLGYITMYRNLAVINHEKSCIEINEDNLDLFNYGTKHIPDWKPNEVELPPYETISTVYLDIETYGLNPEVHPISLIGLCNENGKVIIIDCVDNEAGGLLQFFSILETKKPVITAFFNGFNFDMPFIIKRCEILGIAHPFYVSDKIKANRTACLFGKPATYHNIYMKHDHYQTSFIDLYHQVLSWDFVARKLTSFGLKNCVVELGLVDEIPIELEYDEMLKCYSSWSEKIDGVTGKEKMIEYLRSDLRVTKLLGEFLIPDIYYQKQLLGWSLQALASGGNGTKWNAVLIDHYGDKFLEPDNKMSFTGGLVGGNAGLYKNVSKIDVASLYPSIMLIYQICSIKDVDMFCLSVLKYLKSERLRLKAMANDDSLDKKTRRESKQKQGSKKVLINSAYGSLGVQGLPYNDYIAAAAVTAYGRAILKLMMKTCEEAGGKLISWDTDGLYYTTGDFESNKILYQKIQNAMPNGIVLEYELEALSMYCPPATAKNANDGDAMRKNYIIVKNDGKLKYNGKFRKRDKSYIQRMTMPELVHRYTTNGSHKEYYKNILMSLMNQTYPVENLSITRTIRVNENRLVELGIGNHNDVVTIWKSIDKPVIGKKGKVLKKVEQGWSNSPSDIDWNFYIKLVNEIWDEFTMCKKV